MVSAAGENVGDLVMSGKEALNLPRRLEPLHDPLSSSGRLMGVSARLLRPLCCRCSTPGMISRLAAAPRGGARCRLIVSDHGDEVTHALTMVLRNGGPV